MKKKNVDSVNVFEQISQICRDFRKQISQGRSPRIENFLSAVSDDGRETLFSNLLEIEINFRRSKGQNPTSEEYLKRYSQFARQVRRAFFEPTMASVDSGDGDAATRSIKDAFDSSEHTLTFQIPDANTLGDYELMRELGRGGMGVVYEARHIKTNNRVALKTLPTGGHGQEVNAEKLYRFRREFRRLAEINHPNLVGMQTLEVDGSQWFFTMDLIDGEDFLSYVRPDGELNEKRLRSCIEQLARGVIALHRERIVHRDLKPSNVLVTSDGRVSILDFGLAAEMQRTADMTQTKSGMFAGTPRYAAPEQVFGERTEASDWYAFGTMLYEALSGEPPFTGKDRLQLLRDKQSSEAPLLQGRPSIPEDLATIADGLIRRERTERMNAESVANLLQLNLETRTGGSTAGSQGSSGSVSGEELDIENFEEEEEVVLIGRDEQLAQLEAIKNEFLQSRKPQVVWVTGLSGEGKSSLVQKFLAPIRKGEEMVVLSGRCYDRESVPFKVIDSFIDPLVRFLRSRSDGELKEFLPEDIVALAKLFPMLRRINTISNQDTMRIAGLDDKQVHSLAFVALKELLFKISQRIPILIFVDDLQWGDADSGEAIFKQLASEQAPLILMLGSYRSDEMEDSPFWQVWKKRMADHSDSIVHHRVEVQRLSPQQAVEMLAARTGRSAEEVRRQAGDLIEDAHGNPYFLEQLIEGFDSATGTFRAVPLNEIITTKLQRLPKEATALLNSIAVAGKAVSLSEAAQVSGLSSAAFGIAAHMRSERLLRLIGSGNEQFVDTYHDKIRETILSGLTDQQSRESHLAYGEWIEKQSIGNEPNPRFADLAYHFFHANQRGKAFQYSFAAGQQAMTAFAFSEALSFLDQAISINSVEINIDDRFHLNLLLGKAHAGIGQLDRSKVYFDEAIKNAISGPNQASAYAAIAEVSYKKGDYPSAVINYQNAFASLGEKVPHTLFGKLFRFARNFVAIHAVPASALRLFRRNKRADLRQIARLYIPFNDIAGHQDVFALVDSLTRSCVVAKTLGDDEDICVSLAFYAFLLRLSGVPVLSHMMMKKSRRLESQLRGILMRGFYHYGCSGYFYSTGELAKSEYHGTRSEKCFGKVGDLRQFVAYHFLRHLWSIRGDASKINFFANKEFEIAAMSNDEITMAYGYYGMADARSRMGQFEQGVMHARKSVYLLKKWNATFESIAHMELGRAHLQNSDYGSARLALSHASRLVIKLRFFEISADVFALLAESILGSTWFLNSSSLERKEIRKAKRSARAARFSGLLFPNLRPHAYRISGRVAATRRKHEKAKLYFDKAVAAAEKIGAEYEYARALIDKSMLDYPEANSDRQQGLELLESLGCVLPDAEVEYLGIDRNEHHARAAAARARDSQNTDV